MFSITLLALFSSVSADNTGAKVCIDEAVLTQAKNDLLPKILNNIKSISIPDVHDKIGWSIFSISVSLTNITITDVTDNVSNTNLDFKPTNEVDLVLSQLGAKGTAAFSYSLPIGGGSGSVEFSFSNTNANAQILVEQLNGKLHLQVNQCTVSIGDISVSTSGDVLAKVAEWIADLFKGSLKNTIAKQISSAIEDQVNVSLDNILQGLPSTVQIPNTELEVDLQITAQPVVSDSAIFGSLNGIVLDTKNPNTNPPIPARVPLPAFNCQRRGVQVILSEYDVNSALYAAWQSQLLTVNISSSLIPSSSPVQLNTDFLNGFIGGLVAKYGSNQPVDLICSGLDNPTVTFNAPTANNTSGNVDGKLTSQCAVDVRDKGVAVYLDVGLALDAGVYEDNWLIKGSINSITITSIEAKNSTVSGPIDTNQLETTLNFVFQLFLPSINQQFLANGYPLPTLSFVNLTNTDVTVQKGYIAAEGTPVFTLEEMEIESKRLNNINYI